MVHGVWSVFRERDHWLLCLFGYRLISKLNFKKKGSFFKQDIVCLIQQSWFRVESFLAKIEPRLAHTLPDRLFWSRVRVLCHHLPKNRQQGEGGRTKQRRREVCEKTEHIWRTCVVHGGVGEPEASAWEVTAGAEADRELADVGVERLAHRRGGRFRIAAVLPVH